MRNYFIAPILAIALFAGTFSLQAAGLTEVQIQSILSLLSAFGADASVISNVQTALRGGVPSNTSSSGTDASNSCHIFYVDLQHGDTGYTGSDLSALQNILTLKEHIIITNDISDGSNSYRMFQASTQAAVKQFQAKYGINPTGYVGPLTRAKLNQLYGCKAATYDEGHAEPPPPQYASLPLKDVGSYGSDINRVNRVTTSGTVVAFTNDKKSTLITDNNGNYLIVGCAHAFEEVCVKAFSHRSVGSYITISGIAHGNTNIHNTYSDPYSVETGYGLNYHLPDSVGDVTLTPERPDITVG